MIAVKDLSRRADFSKARADEWTFRVDSGSRVGSLVRDEIFFPSEPPFGPGNETFIFTSASNNSVETASFDGGAGNDTLDATFGAVGFATGGLTTSFTDNGDGTFSATYSRGNATVNGDDSVSIVNIENVFISVFGDSNGVGNEDFVRTGDGDDNIFTDNGADTIVAGKGVDTVDGGTSDEFGERDTISKDFSDVSVDIAWDIQTGVFSGPGSFTGVEVFGTLQTGGGDDTIVSDTFSGSSGRGDSSFSTGAGNDTLSIFDGDDDVDMGSGTDRLILDYRNASFTSNTTMTLSETSAGTYSGSFSSANPNATFQGVEHFTIMTLESGGSGSNLQDTIITGDGDDFISSGASSDNIYAGGGEDTVDGGENGTDIDGLSKEFGAGAPRIVFDLFTNTYFGPGAFTNLEYFIDLRTGSGNDVIDTTSDSSSGRGDDLITTRGGNDQVTVRDGNDTVHLGAGNDLLVIDYATVNTFTSNTTFSITETSPGTYSGQLATGAGTNGVIFTGAERFWIYMPTTGGNGSNLADNITTGDGDDRIFSGRSSDTVFAGGGDDVVDGGEAHDTIDGGDGDDKLYGDTGRDSLIGGNGKDRLFGGDDNDFLDGGSANDKLFGDAGNDTLFGRDGNDRLYGRDGVDALDGGLGNDKIFGDAGADNLLGGDGKDRLFGGDDNDALDGGGGNDKIFGDAGDDEMIGGDGDDRMYGGDGADAIDAGAGDDTLLGDAGDDEMIGGDGDDRMYGGEGNDALSGGSGRDKMFGDAGDDNLIGGGDNDRLFGGDGIDALDGGDGKDKIFGDKGDDNLVGGAGDDRLFGGKGADILSGGDGDDKLFGDQGADTITGGNGEDLYIFRDASGFDTVTDFEDGADRIHLFDYREENGGQALQLDQLLITQNGNDTRIELDLNRDGVADVIDLDGDGVGDAWHVDLLNTDANAITAVDFVF